MKNILLTASLVFGLSMFANTASADVCGQNYESHMVTDPITLVVTAVNTPTFFNSCEGNDPMKATQAWGLDGAHTPQVKSGAVVIDEAGLVDSCPAWYPVMGCFDITKTSYYKDKMRDTAKQISSKGNHFTQNFAYWLNH